MQRAGEFNIKLEDVSITHLTFGKVSLDIDSSSLIIAEVFEPTGIHASGRSKADCTTRYIFIYIHGFLFFLTMRIRC